MNIKLAEVEYGLEIRLDRSDQALLRLRSQKPFPTYHEGEVITHENTAKSYRIRSVHHSLNFTNGGTEAAVALVLLLVVPA